MTKRILVQRNASDEPPGRIFALWFGALGGAIAWIVQFTVLYLLAETACHSNRFAFTMWGCLGLKLQATR